MQKPPTGIRLKEKRPGFIEFETAVEITGRENEKFGSSTYKPPNHSGQFGIQPANVKVSANFFNTKKLLAEGFQNRANQLPQIIENELAATRLEGETNPVSPIQGIIRELGVIHKLWTRKTAELTQKTIMANTFYGYDPIGRSWQEFAEKAKAFESPLRVNGLGTQVWTISYTAAYDAMLLSQTIDSLSQRSIHLGNMLAPLQAAEQARLRAEAQALAHSQEQARLAALAEAERVAAEQARIAAEAAAQYIAAERARLVAEAEVQRQAEQLHLEMQRQAEEQVLRKAMESLNAGNGVRPFSVSGAAAANGPVFAVGAGTLAIETATALAVRTALRTAAATAITALAAAVGTASGVVIVVGVAALVYYALRDTKEPYALSVPLSDFATYDDDQLRPIAMANGEIDLPVAIGTRTVDNKTEFSVAATNGTTVPGKVPVRLATYDPVLNVYRTERPNAESPGMTWTPIVSPGNASTGLPVAQPDVAPYTGATATSLEGRLDPNPELDLYSFGGEIYVFPIESGIPPQLVMFRDRRNEPGVTSGAGQSVSGNWMGTASTPEGAPIPAQIADKLQGRKFSTFKNFRSEFWKAVSNDEQLSGQFTKLRQMDMKQGLAPTAFPHDQVGRRIKYEIHHIIPISEGGEVYDMDNLQIMTPKSHIQAHAKTKEQKNDS